MPNRRKSKEELRREALGDTSTDPDDDAAGVRPPADLDGFEAVSEQDRVEANALFQVLNALGFVTCDDFDVSLESDGERLRRTVSVTAALPNRVDQPLDDEALAAIEDVEEVTPGDE